MILLLLFQYNYCKSHLRVLHLSTSGNDMQVSHKTQEKQLTGMLKTWLIRLHEGTAVVMLFLTGGL